MPESKHCDILAVTRPIDNSMNGLRVLGGSLSQFGFLSTCPFGERELVNKDPICGRTVDEETVLRAECDIKIYYFWCDICWQKFLSTPAGSKPEGKLGSCFGKSNHFADKVKQLINKVSQNKFEKEINI